MMKDRPKFMGNLLKKILSEFTSGSLHPIPFRSFKATSVIDAFSYMAHAKQIGKIILSMKDVEMNTNYTFNQKLTFFSDATYLVTGGLSGFGLATARWLVQSGVRHLMLIGRRGASTLESKDELKRLKEMGAEVSVIKADVTMEKDMVDVLKQINNSMPPLRGVFHAAMVLEDATILQLNEENMEKVMAPKVLGAWNLHKLTSDIPLEQFVLYSSVVTLYGNPGQGNYVAANFFLDTLAHYRRSIGLPALSINWGAIGDIGHVAQHAEIAEHLNQIGVHTLSSHKAFRSLEQLILQDITQASVASMNWKRWVKNHPVAASSPRYTYVVDSVGQSELQKEDLIEGDSLRDDLISADSSERQVLLEKFLIDQLAKVIGTSTANLDCERSLNDLGLDSLMAIDMGFGIKKELGVDVATMKLFGGANITQIALEIGEELFKKETITTTGETTEILENMDLREGTL